MVQHPRTGFHAAIRQRDIRGNGDIPRPHMLGDPVIGDIKPVGDHDLLHKRAA